MTNCAHEERVLETLCEGCMLEKECRRHFRVCAKGSKKTHQTNKWAKTKWWRLIPELYYKQPSQVQVAHTACFRVFG